MSKKELQILITLAAVQFTNILDFMVLMPLSPQIMGSFNLEPDAWSYLVGAYTAAATVSGILTLFFIDKIGRRQFLMTVYAGFMIGTVMCALSNTYELLLSSRIIAGLFGGALGAVNMSILGDVIPNEKRGRAMGILMIGFSTASSLGVPIGLKISEMYGWNAPFYGVVIMALAVMVMIFIFIPPLKGHLELQTGNTFQSLIEVFKSFNQVKALFFMFILVLGHFLIIPFIAAYMENNVGINEDELFYIYLFGGVTAMFSGMITGKISDVIGKQKVFIAGVLLTLIPIYFITTMEPSALWYAILITTLFFILNTIRIIPGMALIVGAAEPKTRGVFMGVRSAIQMFASTVAAMIGGFIVVEDESTGLFLHYDVLGYVALGVSVAAIFLVGRFKSVN